MSFIRARLLSRMPSHFSPKRVLTSPSRRWATSITPRSSASDPAESEALRYFEQALEECDVHAAKELYKRSIEIRRNFRTIFNLGITHYHLGEFDEAISAWKESIALQPSNPEAHLNLAITYLASPVSRPGLVLHHLQLASFLAPEHPGVAFSYAAALEATGRLEEALEQYKRSKELGGPERAVAHIQNVSAKILRQRMKSAEESGKSDE